MADNKLILIIGIGNPYRCDDGIGLRIAGRLAEILPDCVDVRENVGDGFSLMDLWQDYKHVYLIDAVSAGQAPGQIYRFDALNEKLPHDFFTNYSTHSINILETIALAKDLDRLPKALTIYGVEGTDFRIGPEISEEVREALGEVVLRIEKEIKELV